MISPDNYPKLLQMMKYLPYLRQFVNQNHLNNYLLLNEIYLELWPSYYSDKTSKHRAHLYVVAEDVGDPLLKVSSQHPNEVHSSSASSLRVCSLKLLTHPLVRTVFEHLLVAGWKGRARERFYISLLGNNNITT